MRRTLAFCLMFAIGWLAGCADGERRGAQDAAHAPESAEIATLVATPTLVPALAALADASPTTAPTPTRTPRPSPTPGLQARIELGQRALHNGEFAAAVDHLGAALVALPDDASAEHVALQLDLLRAYSAGGNTIAVLQLGQGMLRQPDAPPDVQFFIAEAHAANGDCAAAVTAYRAGLDIEPLLAALLYARIAACELSLGNDAAAIAAYEQAVAADAHYLVTYQNRLALARLYADRGDLGAAADVYQTIADNARTDYTRAEMGYLAAQTRLLIGESAAARAGLQTVVDRYPTQPSAYLALIELMRLDVQIDQYQRGLIDYHAQVPAPCVEAFDLYLADNPDDFRPDALLYLSGCHEQLGNRREALAQLTRYATLGAAEASAAQLESGQIYRRAEQWDQAIATFAALVADSPTSAEAPVALWWLARLHDWQGDAETAIDYYTQLADDYPDADNAAEALFRAGWLTQSAGRSARALVLWQRAAGDYPGHYHGQAALTWALRQAPEDPDLLALAAAAAPGFRYYSVRNRDIAAGIAPFAPADGPPQPLTPRDQAATEAYLRAQLDLPEDGPLDTLPPFVQEDLHIRRGERLWSLRQFEEAKREFELVREAYSDNALVSYQLALYFRDIGLYRSSIIAAERAIVLLGETPFSAPRFLASLAYPTYYADLIEPLADQYDYDPLVQYALVRQESLYESFATSSAVAQGLAQVIPDTGRYIAGKLAWPNYVNADLYRPTVGLRFGGFYLAEQLALFDGETYAALAAYNGGPGNALRWFNQAGADIDRFVETVNFPETRSYIERIYVGHAVYRHLYGGSR